MKCSSSWQCPPGSMPYRIQEGDTVYSIARRYGTTAERLLEINGDININNLIIGSEICIPLPTQYYPMCRTTNYYVVNEGDTIYSIANYFGVSINQILYSNIGVTPENIYRGMVLCIPIAKPPVCVHIEGGELNLSFDSGEVRTYRCRGEEKSARTMIQVKQLTGSDGEGKRLILSEENMSICSENICGGGDIILSVSDMDEVFNFVTVGTEVTIS